MQARIGILALAAFAASCTRAPRDERPMDRPARPDSIVVEASVRSGGRSLATLRRHLGGGPAALAVPDTVRGLVGRFVAWPAGVEERIERDAPAVAIWLDAGDALDWVVATTVQVAEEYERPLGANVPTRDGAPHRTRWIGARPREGETAFVVASDALVAASSVRALETALPYVTDALRTRTRDGLQATVEGRWLGTMVRRSLEPRAEQWAAEALEAVTRERATRATAPTLGDPERVVELLRTEVRDALAMLPDLGAITLDARIDADGLLVEATATTRPSSLLAERIAQLPSMPADSIADVDASRAVALVSASSARGAPRLTAFRAIAGERVRSADHAAWDEVEAALRPARGWSLGVGERSVDVGVVGMATPAPRDAIRRWVETPFVRAWLETATSCEVVDLAKLFGGEALCEAGAGVRLDVRPSVVMMTIGPPHGAMGGSPTRTLREDADVRRALSAVNEPVAFALYAEPRRLVHGLSAWTQSAALGRHAEELAPATTNAPILATLGARDATLRAHVVITSAALEAIARAGVSFGALR